MIRIFEAFLFLLPLTVSLLGIFFLNKGREYYSHLNTISNALRCSPMPGSFAVVSGNAVPQDDLVSFVDLKSCVYSYLKFEYLDPKKNSWYAVREFQRKKPFFVECSGRKYLVDPLGAEFDIKEIVYQEEKKSPVYGRGTMGNVREFRYNLTGINPLYSYSRTAEPPGTLFDALPFEEKIYEGLEKDPEIKQLLTKLAKFRKRITIQTIYRSDDVVVAGTAISNKESISIVKGAGKFIISTEGTESITKQLKGRAIISAVLGLAAIMVSVLLFAFLISF